MIFGVARVFNLAHGAFVLLGAYIAIWVQAKNDVTIALPQPGWGLGAAFALSVGGVTLLAPLIYRFFVRPIRDRPILTFMITLLFALLVEEIITLLFTSNSRALPPLIPSGVNVPLFGTAISANRFLGSGIALGAIGALWLFVNHTKTGKAILALSMSRVGATLIGVNEERIHWMTWAISGALSAVAGIFLASFLGTSPTGGRFPLVVSFTIVILGGLGSIQGSLLAAYIVGYAETLAQFLLGAEYRGLPSLLLLVVILLLRPQGLLGRGEA